MYSSLMKLKKSSLCFLLVSLILSSCGGSSNNPNTDDGSGDTDTDYRQLMRNFVQDISSYAKGLHAGFIIIPQNGHALLTDDGTASGEVSAAYVAAIDGVGREDLFYGYDQDDEATPDSENSAMTAFMDIATDNGVQVLATDYCSTHSYMDDSYQQNEDRGYISFAADQRDLNNIPEYPAEPHNVNELDVSSLSDAKNFLYIINTDGYSSKSDFIDDVALTNYDLVLIDLYFEGSEELTADDVTALKTKANGGERLVIAYMSIGEAEDYRSYWQSDWNTDLPSWVMEENKDWPGNYKVQYWDDEWQEIIYGNNSSYLKNIIAAGFDGVYLDIIDAYEYFEED